MKKSGIILLATVLVLSSCNDFLDRSSVSEITSDNVFTSATLAENVVAGVYSNLAYDYNNYDRINWDAYSSVLDALSPYAYMQGRIQSNNSTVLAYWKRFFEGVNRANDVINNIGQVPDMDDGTKARRIAECKFLRAWHYYKLNCLWGGVPIYLENLSPKEYTRQRSSEEDVWTQVIKDCTECIDCEAIPDKIPASSPDYGRITRGAAYVLRGKAYMWLKEYEKAEKDFRSVGDCGYSLFTGSYADLFKEKNERCDEMIFSVQMVETSEKGNVLSFIYGNFNTAGYGNNRIVAGPNFIDSYETLDGEAFDWETVIPGYTSLSPAARSAYFFRNSLTDNEKLTLSSAGADMSLYDSMNNEARIQKAYENRDPRLSATFILPYSTYLGGSTGTAETYTMRFPYRSDTTPNFDLKAYNTTQMIYLVRKFVAEGVQYKNISYNPVDMPVFRYADVLLSLAEAVNEQGRYLEAVPYVNQVRSRAGAKPLNSNDATRVTSQENMRERIRREKKWELAGENQLYWEELRWGSWKDDKFKEGNGLQQCWGSSIYDYIWGGDQYLHWPVPRSEVEKAGLSQNDKWY